MPTHPAEFSRRLLAWFDQHGRHDLPWQHPRSAYRVWLAEIMLQQTQVATVIPYYQRFLDRFPDLPALAAASRDEVLALWAGLGYYSRARNLHLAAQRCVEEHDGTLPRSPDLLQALPGIGRSTAAAIAAQAFEQPTAILDGNVKRLLCRLYGIADWPGLPAVERELWQYAERLMPAQRCADYTQAIMDFGATLCRRGKPDCARCPFSADCVAHGSGQTAHLPSPRPRKTLPWREQHVAVLIDAQHRVLLQRNPPSGIWSDLWSLPQFDAADALDHFTQRFTPIQAGSSLAPISHGFTHFQLRLLPQLIRIAAVPKRVSDNDQQRWLDRQQLDQLGLPAPIRRLIDRIEEIH